MTDNQRDIMEYHKLTILNGEDKLNHDKRYIFKDKDGYKYKTSISVLFNSKKRDNKLNRFFRGNPFTKRNINLYLKLNNSDAYLIDSVMVYINKNARSNLEFMCFKHGKFKRSWNEIYPDECGCQTCGDIIKKEKKRNSYDYVYDFCSSVGFKLISKNYGNNEHSLYFQCKTHGKIKTSFGEVISGKFICRYCYLDSLKDPSTCTEEILKLHDLVLLKDASSSTNTMTVFCKRCDGEVNHSFNYIKSPKFKCSGCKKLNGELKPTRDGSVSKDWRVLVYKKYNYRCDICNEKGKKNALNAHHLNSWHWSEEERFNVENGVCLCPNHHGEFHKRYTYFNNTKEQYIEFKQEIKQGKF